MKKQNMVELAGHVARMVRREIHVGFWLKNYKERVTRKT
jgi:hypothetical protein